MPESARARIRHLQAENQRLRAILEEFDSTSQSIFSSLTWRFGRTMAWPLHKLRLVPERSAREHVDFLRREYRALNAHQSDPGDPPLSGRWATLKRLLNRNTLGLMLLALRELPKTGVRGFIGRSLAYLELNRLEETVARRPNLGRVLRLLHLAVDPPPASAPALDPPIDILVPIYNGLHYLRDLLPRIMANTDLPYRLILIDDASPDPAVGTYLRDFAAGKSQVLLVRNSANLGFVATVNKGYTLVRNHFVILNQDTEVPPGWLSRLMRPLLEGRRVASVTPYTNAGTICSFPDFLEDCPRFENLPTDTLDQCFRWIDVEAVGEIEIPTGVGFCMAINKDVADAIGLFNAEIFGRGYGEENDWCRRAIAAGYRNLMVPNLFVYHTHGGVFDSEEKQQLLARNLAEVNRLHPAYGADVNRFIARDPLRPVRDLMLLLAISQTRSRIRLVVDHGLGGGANAFVEQRRSDWLAEGDAVLALVYHARQTRYGLSVRFRDRQLDYALDDPAELLQLFEFIRLDSIHLNSLVSHPDVMAMLSLLRRLKTRCRAELCFYLHDYHAISPVYTLIDDTGRYCGVPSDLRRCERCLARNRGEFRLYYPSPDRLDIRLWRRAWSALLHEADHIVCFSRASSDILQRAYPDESVARAIRIEPHQTPPLPAGIAPRRHAPVDPEQPLVIGVLGAINLQKGIGILAAMASRIARERLPVRLCVIGYVSEPLPADIVTVTGRYRRADLPSLIEHHRIDLFFLPSIWPETYLFTADEVMMLGLPLAIFNLGAPVERVSGYRAGLVIDRIDPDVALDAIIEFAGRGHPTDGRRNGAALH